MYLEKFIWYYLDKLNPETYKNQALGLFESVHRYKRRFNANVKKFN